ncbi:MAG: glutathione transferase [Burkholderiales bacterium]|nr:glutathione transferase [Burkholderiales bacterium]MBI3730662.1 glutathione transferase [Burkholderiales bacterium]
MQKQDIKLYVDSQFASPYAMSVFVTLHEKGLDFDLLTVDLEADAQHAPDYAATSLTQRVPTLVHNGFALSESSAITEYLEEVFPQRPVYPKETQARARARQVQAWIRSALMPIRVERNTQVIFYGKKLEPLSDAARVAAAQLFLVGESLVPDNAGNLFGDWTVADLDLALMINRLALHGDHVPEKLVRFAAQQWQRPAVQLWVNQARPAL